MWAHLYEFSLYKSIVIMSQYIFYIYFIYLFGFARS